MTDEQRAELEAGQRCNDFNSNADNLIVIGGIEGMNDIINGIANKVEAIETAESAQQHDYGDIKDDKELAKKEMAKQVIKFARRGKVKAQQLGLTAIATALDHPSSYILTADAVLAITRATDMKDLMDDNKGPGGVLTNIVVGNITTMTEAIDNFDELKHKPTENIKTKKADGTDLIQPEIDSLKSFIAQQIDLMHSYLDDTDDAPMVNEFELDAHAIILGRKHNIVLAHLIKEEDGTAITNGKFTCLRNGKFANGNTFNDKYQIERITQGEAHFTATAPGRIPVELDIEVLKGKTVEVTIRMKLI